MTLAFRFATEADIPALLNLRLAVKDDQERRFGMEQWSPAISVNSVTRGLRSSRVLVAVQRGGIVGTLRMASRKPWAIALQSFTPVANAVYLHDVSVEPRLQRSGIGEQLLERAKVVARAWPAEAIRLDAYDGPSGAGPFYAACGFTQVGRAVYRGVPLVYFELVFGRDAPDHPRLEGDGVAHLPA
jgi:GNAT superfamily N-acetyltransferase